jgi:hypothetical protein
MKKKTIGCVIVIVVILAIVLLILMVLIHDRNAMEFLAPTYQMNHDPKTKAEVQEYIDVVFPDSVKWEKCYIENAWDGVYTFCARFTIPENDFNEMIPTDIEFEHFQGDLRSMPLQVFLLSLDFESYIHEDIGKLNDLDVFYYCNDENHASHYLVFIIDHSIKRSDGRIVSYIFSQGYGHRLVK